MSVEGISIREFARRDGCNDKLVRRKIASGHLATLPDGKLDPALVGTAWREGNVRGGAASADVRMSADTEPTPSAAEKDETAAQVAKRLVYEEGRVFTSEAEAKRHKESFLALHQELEYDRKIGKVVLIDDVVSAITGEYAIVRNRLLNVASRVAPRAAVLRSAEEVKALIDEEVGLALEELSLDGHGGASPDDLGQSLRERFASVS